MDTKTKGLVHTATLTLVLVGAANWGLVGLFNYNLVTSLLGVGVLTQLVYVLVGLSAVYLLLTHKEDCKTCAMMMKPAKKKKR